MGILTDALIGGVGGAADAGFQGAKMGYNAELLNQHEQQKAQIQAARDERNARLTDQLTRGRLTEVEQPFTAEQNRQKEEAANARQGMQAESAQEVARINHENDMEKIRLTRRWAQIDAMKDLPASVKSYVDMQRERLKGLDTLENSQRQLSPEQDSPALQNIASQKSALTDLVEEALRTKAIPKRPAAAPAPKPAGGATAASFWGKMTDKASAAVSAGFSPTAPAAQTTTGNQPPVDTGPQSGGAVDVARQKLSLAQSTLQRYGLTKRKSDPNGFAAAQAAVQAAQSELDAAMSTYQGDLGPIGAANRLPLRTH